MPISKNLACVRFPDKTIDCRMTSYSLLLNQGSFEIHEPLAVDIFESSTGKGGSYYSAKMRVKNSTVLVPLTLTQDSIRAIEIAKEINNFLLESEERSFSTFW